MTEYDNIKIPKIPRLSPLDREPVYIPKLRSFQKHFRQECTGLYVEDEGASYNLQQGRVFFLGGGSGGWYRVADLVFLREGIPRYEGNYVEILNSLSKKEVDTYKKHLSNLPYSEYPLKILEEIRKNG